MLRLFVLIVDLQLCCLWYFLLWCCLVCLYVVFDFGVHWMTGSCSEQFGFLSVCCCWVLYNCCISKCLCIIWCWSCCNLCVQCVCVMLQPIDFWEMIPSVRYSCYMRGVCILFVALGCSLCLPSVLEGPTGPANLSPSRRSAWAASWKTTGVRPPLGGQGSDIHTAIIIIQSHLQTRTNIKSNKWHPTENKCTRTVTT